MKTYSTVHLVLSRLLQVALIGLTCGFLLPFWFEVVFAIESGKKWTHPFGSIDPSIWAILFIQGLLFYAIPCLIGGWLWSLLLLSAPFRRLYSHSYGSVLSVLLGGCAASVGVIVHFRQEDMSEWIWAAPMWVSIVLLFGVWGRSTSRAIRKAAPD